MTGNYGFVNKQRIMNENDSKKKQWQKKKKENKRSDE